ncbi:MAG: DNA alkylation repair protein [bacterium]
MTQEEVLKQLQEFGTVQNRKVYRRHGVGEDLYGVSYANLGKLKKRIKTDHELAIKLWQTGNHDASILATMIADPAKATDEHLESWVQDLSNYVITDAFASYAAKTGLAQKKMEQWTRSSDEWVGRAGWLVLAHLAMHSEELSDRYFEPYLEIIEKDIHASRNRVKDAMNSALAALGIYRESLSEKALSAARKIGKVEVDHGETGCKTPDAESYIQKALERKSKRAK